jgi:hypothetical protein
MPHIKPKIEHQCYFEEMKDDYTGTPKEFSKCKCGAVSNFVSEPPKETEEEKARR